MNHPTGPAMQMHPNRKAFTLVEILVVIGVITLLVGLLLPMVRRSYVAAGKARAQADLQSISIAVEAYRQDFGDIPRLPIDVGGYVNPISGQPYPNTGAATLGKALLGPYGDGLLPAGGQDNADPPVYQASTAYRAGDVFRASAGTSSYVTLVDADMGAMETDGSIFAHFDANDGADGPGFRKRPGNAGPVSPPYLQAGKVAVRGTYLLDHYGHPVLYFPASPRKRDLTKASNSPDKQAYVDQSPIVLGGLGPTYNASDNFEQFARRTSAGPRMPQELSSTGDPIILTRIRIMLGDSNGDGYIDSTDGPETAVTQPYLLWSAGPDGLFGPAAPAGAVPAAPIPSTAVGDMRALVEKCDDVTNFHP